MGENPVKDEGEGMAESRRSLRTTAMLCHLLREGLGGTIR